MKRQTHIFVLAAFALLLAAATDLLIVDFASGIICEDQVPGSANALPDDDCFCCCAHIVIPVTPITLPSQPSQAFVPLTDPGVASLQASAVYHPPRI